MEAATDHDSIIRAQARCQLLRALCSGFLEMDARARVAPVSPPPLQSYMRPDFLDSED